MLLNAAPYIARTVSEIVNDTIERLKNYVQYLNTPRSLAKFVSARSCYIPTPVEASMTYCFIAWSRRPVFITRRSASLVRILFIASAVLSAKVISSMF